MSVFEKDKADDDRSDLNAELRDIPPETRRAQSGFRQGGVPMERSEDFGGAVRRLGILLRPDYPALLLILAMALGSTILNVMGPRILGRATDVVIQGLRTQQGTDFSRLHHILFEAGEVYVGGALLGVGIAYVLAGVVQRLMYRLREQAEEKVHSLPLSYIDQQARGDLLSRVTNDLDNVAQTMQQTLSQMLTSVLLLVGVAFMMFTISPFLAPIALITVPVALWTMRTIGKRARPKFIEQWRSTGQLNAQIEETFTGHSIVKAFGRQHEVEARFEETNEVLFQSSFGAQFMSSLMQPATMFLSNVQYVIVAVVGGLRVATGAISIGDVQAFIQYSRQFAMPLTQLASMMNTFQSGIASLERVLELLDAEDQVPDRDNELPAPVRGRVVFDDVSFSYNPDRALIEGLELVAEPGQTIAIVGPTGAGKTTLVNLIMRFYELDAGFITLDGVDTASIPRSELRNHLGMVLQDTWLFGGTIRDNIAYGNPDATEEQILEAAKACYVDRFVHNLPDGYDTLINEEGDNISAGQKQLLTIARAFLADRSILILDEATSSVDTRTEVQVQVAMNRLRKNRTSFVIAHRLSTIRGADTILVMQNGTIVEQGSHEELLAHDGPYFRLYSSQFAGAVTESDPNAVQS
jgi:ATP-binding cassette subfamily B protein